MLRASPETRRIIVSFEECESESLRVTPVAREESFCSDLVENVSTHRGALYNQHTDGFSLFIVVTKLIHAKKSINVPRFALERSYDLMYQQQDDRATL